MPHYAEASAQEQCRRPKHNSKNYLQYEDEDGYYRSFLVHGHLKTVSKSFDSTGVAAGLI